MKIEDAMTKEFYTAMPSTNLVDIAVEMKRHNVGAIPIVENNRLVGIITDRDIVLQCVAAGVDPKKCTAQQFMTGNPLTVGPDDSIEQAAEMMAKEQIHRLPVVKEGRLIGMIALGDVAVELGDDRVVAETLRRISMPVRSHVSHPAAGRQQPGMTH